MMQENKIKLIICGDSLNGFSGLSNVSTNIMKYFYETNNFDIAYYGVVNKPITKANYKFYGESFKECFENVELYDFNTTNFDTVCSEFKPDIVLSIHDPWLLNFIPESKYRHTFYWINYCLFETPEYPNYIMGYSKIYPRTEIGKILRDADCSIPVTKMGKGALEKLKVQNIQENIYLGMDFDKVVKDAVKKKEVFNVNEDDFVFMTCGKNLERKRIDLILEAFSIFLSKIKKEDKHKYKLYVHTDFNENAGGTDLLTQLLDLGIADNFLGALCFTQNKFLMHEELFLKYKACDCYIGLPSAEGFGLSFCSPKGTSIITENFIKNIEDIKENDRVYSHTGNIKKVTGITNRPFVGNLYTVTTISNLALSVTEGHRLFGLKYKKRFTKLKERDLNPSWYPVETFVKGDLLAIPKLKNIYTKIDTIKISDYVSDITKQDNLVFYKMSRKTKNKDSLNTIANKFNCSFQMVGDVISGRRRYNSELANNIKKYANEIDYHIPDSIKCLDEIELTPDVMRFFGLYIAEGSSNKNSFEISLHEDEKELQELSIAVSLKIFGNVEIIRRVRKGTKSCSIIISSKIAATLLESLFGKGAVNKRIPKIFFNSSNISYLVKGYFEGDGCFKNGVSATTISKELSFDLYTLLNMQNILLSIHLKNAIGHTSISNNVKNKEGIIHTRHVSYTIKIYEQYLDKFCFFTGICYSKYSKNKTIRKQNFIKENDSYFFTPIRKIENKQINTHVYNLHVEDDESYLAEGLSSHNCEALAHNKPVIYTDYAGPVEYCNDYGFPVKLATTLASRSAYLKLGIADVHDAARQMQNVVDKKYHQKYLKAYDELKDKFDWKVLLPKLCESVLKNYTENKKEFNLKRIV